MSAMVSTTCPYCGVGCGVNVRVQDVDERVIQISGDNSHPANRGRLCGKGLALADTVTLEGRLLQPMIGETETDWSTALNEVAIRLQQVLDEHGPEAIGFYLSGQMLTEDYYVANKLCKGFLGTANVDTNSRLCMASSVAGHKKAFGSDTVPVRYEDLDNADLVVLVGSNLAWCHPVLYQRLREAKALRPDMRIVVIDPRATDTVDIADLHLAIAPGSDTMLFNGALHQLRLHAQADYVFLEQHVEGFSEALNAAERMAADPVAVAQACGVSVDALARFYQWFCYTEKAVTVYSQGVNQSTIGTEKVLSIINCHLFTGRIGKPGMGPFSVTGQPNAMGGREVGGLANQLAAHMDFDADSVDRVARFWNAPNIVSKPGLKAVDLFQAVADGRIKFLWIIATNPAVSMPEAARVAKAIASCPTVVVSDCIKDTDTVRLAKIKLPATAWAEKSGTVTNSERCISRQRGFLPAPGEAKPDWWIICEVAKRLGFVEAFSYQHEAEIFREHARLSAFENFGRRDFDLGALAGISEAEYQQLPPQRWPLRATKAKQPKELFEDGRFFTANGKARMHPVVNVGCAVSASDAQMLRLNTGRSRDQWHTMTRTGLASRLNQHQPEPTLTLSAFDAASRGIAQGDLVQARSVNGAATLRAEIADAQRPGQVFAPIHWSDTHSANAVISALVTANTDPFSGQPELKAMPVEVNKWPLRWQGFVLTREACDVRRFGYWTMSKTAHGWRYEIAGQQAVADWSALAKSLLGERSGDQWLAFHEASGGSYRAMCVRDGYLQAALIISSGALPERDWLLALFAEPLNNDQRLALLAARPLQAQKQTGRCVCSCMQVGEQTIRRAIADGADSVAVIGQCTQAGTQCGSCVPELKRLLLSTVSSASQA